MSGYPVATFSSQTLSRPGWTWRRLQEIAKLESGHTPSRKQAAWWGGNIPWLALPDIRFSDGKIISDTIEKTNPLGLKNSSARLLPKDTIALSRTASVGFVTRFGRPMATSQDFANWICGPELDPGFLMHALRCSRPGLMEVSSGAIHKTIYMNVLEDLRLFLPPLPEQKRIAAELDQRLALIGEAREAAERRLAAAEQLESALFREVFRGVTPVSIGAGREGFRRLSEVARLESGHTPSRRRPEWWGGEIPWIALPDIRALDGKVAMETIRHTNPEGIANSSARILPKDTVVFGRDVQVGFTTITGRPMATSQHFFNWICGDGLNPRYLMHTLRASRAYLQSMSSGAIHQTIYMPAARDFHLLLPDRKTQNTLAADLDTRLAHTATILRSTRAELEAIKALPAAALREVFG